VGWLLTLTSDPVRKWEIGDFFGDYDYNCIEPRAGPSMNMARSFRQELTTDAAPMLLHPMSLDWLRALVSAQTSVVVSVDAFVDRTKGGLNLMVLEPQALTSGAHVQ
jgi:hypothetical protein